MAPAGPPSPADLAHLERARALARRGWGRVHPNPLVGCVLVADGRVVGEGWHRDFGGPHAEVEALERAGGAARGATAYVSLEPCDHQGKTPPCTRALLAAGVARVVFGASDPGPGSGGGAATLRAAGVAADGPLWDERAAWAENPAFFHAARGDGPFVALKLAMSLDARIAAAPGACTRITGPEAEREVHRLRTGFDAIMVGAGTVRADDPRLTVREAPPGRVAPRRIVLLGRDASIPREVALLRDVASVPLDLFVPEDAGESVLEALEALGAHVHPAPAREGRPDLHAVLSTCASLGIASILCEGGARLAGALLAAGRVQRLYLFVAPVTLGGDGVPAFGDDADRLDWSAFEPAFPPERHGRDTLLVLDRGPA